MLSCFANSAVMYWQVEIESQSEPYFPQSIETKPRPNLQFKQQNISVKNQNFGQKSRFWSNNEIFVKNRNYGQKLKFWSNNEIFVKNRNFGQKSKFWSKIEILVK